MRSPASAGTGPGCANEAGGPADDAVEPGATTTSASVSAARVVLPKRLTRLGVEEVQPAEVDRHRDLRLEPEHDVRRELRDEVRARAHRALAGRRVLRVLADLDVADRPRVDPQVGDRLRAERLDE